MLHSVARRGDVRSVHAPAGAGTSLGITPSPGFNQHYSSGQTPAAALRLAQLATIGRLESQGAIADPARWAAFTIAGPPATETTANGSIKTWRSANGKYTVEAELVSVDGQRVVLRKLDGAKIQLPLSQLHQDARQNIASAIGRRIAN